MPRTEVLFYADEDGKAPVVDWLEGLDNRKAAEKCLVALSRLADLGHELRRPEAGLLRDGVYELRVGFRSINYRILYGFHERTRSIVVHGIVKEEEVPPREIDRAIERLAKFRANPARHTYRQ